MSWLSERWNQAGWAVTSTLMVGGKVSIVGIEPGRVAGLVQDRVTRHVELGFAKLGEEAKEDLANLLARRPVLLAAVMAGRFSDELARSLAEMGHDMVPSQSELLIECDCDSYVQPCRHGEALVSEVGQLCESDPFAFGLLRGLDRDSILTRAHELRGSGSSQGGATYPRGTDPGAPAAAAYRRTPSDPPSDRPAPAFATRSVATDPAPPLDSGLTALDLAELVNDAAERAVELLASGFGPHLRGDQATDLARRASSLAARGLSVSELATAAKIDPIEMEEQARCWDVGGELALAVATDSWQPDSSDLEAAVVCFDPPGRTTANRVASGQTQLRLDKTGIWWRFEASPDRGWVMASSGFARPEDALDDELDQMGQAALPE